MEKSELETPKPSENPPFKFPATSKTTFEEQNLVFIDSNPLPLPPGFSTLSPPPSRTRYWLSVGAQPSDPVQRLLFRAGMLPPPPMLEMSHKSGPRDTRPIDPMTERYLTSEKPTNSDQSVESEGGEDGDEDGEDGDEDDATTS